MFQIVEASMNYIYLNAKELAERLDCEPETVVRNKKFLEGIHFVFPPGSNRKRFIWDNIERDMLSGAFKTVAVPMARGGYCYG